MYRSKKGTRFEKPYPYVRRSSFSEFDVIGMREALKSCGPSVVLGSYQADLNYLIYTFCREGSNLNKTIAKRSKGVINNPQKANRLRILKELVDNYGIVDKPSSMSTPTLWRIGCLYCREATLLLHKQLIKPFLNAQNLGSDTQPLYGYPLAMMHSVFAPLIPSPASCTISHLTIHMNNSQIQSDTIVRIEDEGALGESSQTLFIFPAGFGNQNNQPTNGISEEEITFAQHPPYKRKMDTENLESSLIVSNDGEAIKTDYNDNTQHMNGDHLHAQPSTPDLIGNVKQMCPETNPFGNMKPVINPSDFECLYYGYAHHQRVFYKTITDTAQALSTKQTLKKTRDILNFIDQQIAYPILTEAQKFQFLEKIGILVRCQPDTSSLNTATTQSGSYGDHEKTDESTNNTENSTPQPHLVFQLSYSVRAALQKAKQHWETFTDISRDPIFAQVMNLEFGLNL